MIAVIDDHCEGCYWLREKLWQTQINLENVDDGGCVCFFVKFRTSTCVKTFVITSASWNHSARRWYQSAKETSWLARRWTRK